MEQKTDGLEETKRLYLRAQFDGAFEGFKKEAARGSGEAMYFLGEFYGNGYGHVSQDLKKAFSWRKKGAEAGNLLAKLNISYHLPAKGGKRQQAAALLFPEVLAVSEAGDIFAQNELADMYLYGLGTKRNTETAISWLERAGHDGFWRPLNKLGEIFHYGEGVAKDEEKAMRYFSRAAALGYGDAEGNLAMGFYRAKNPDYEKTRALLRRAFAHGALYEGEIANVLGIMCVEGQGGKEDREEGFAWLLRAAACGSMLGMNHLAICYEQGIGTAENKEMAERWSKRAADKGQAEAAVRYGIFQREKGKLKTAAQYFKKAAEKGNPDGEVWYASCFLFGLGEKEDKETAREWLERAASKGEKNAVDLLKKELGIEWKEK